jgi:hypothetical protein
MLLKPFRHFEISEIGGSRRLRFSTTGITKTRNPKFLSGRDQVCEEAMTGEKEGPVNQIFNRDSSEESKEPLRLEGEIRTIR